MFLPSAIYTKDEHNIAKPNVDKLTTHVLWDTYFLNESQMMLTCESVSMVTCGDYQGGLMSLTGGKMRIIRLCTYATLL